MLIWQSSFIKDWEIVANFVSNDSDLADMLKLIYKNQGAIPSHNPPPDGRMENQQPEDTMLERRPGLPFNQETPFSTRYFYIRFDDNGEVSGFGLEHITAVTGWSVLADVICIVLVYILVVLFSGRAINFVVKSAERQKQFITDAGHELKTPITVIATSLKVLEMETGKQKWIDKAKAQTEKLIELVNSMVTLSRLDEEESPLKLADFSISETVSETAESFRDFSESKGHELQISVTDDIGCCGDEYAVPVGTKFNLSPN